MAPFFFVLHFTIGGCLPGTSESAFIGGRDELRCGNQGVFPQCRGKSASCILDKDTYTSGFFPGSRKVLVETPPGSWEVHVRLFLDPTSPPRAPGTDTDIFWYEPGCSKKQTFNLAQERVAGDLFQKAGVDNVLSVSRVVSETGDHLIEIQSDAVTRYLLRVDITQIED